VRKISTVAGARPTSGPHSLGGARESRALLRLTGPAAAGMDRSIKTMSGFIAHAGRGLAAEDAARLHMGARKNPMAITALLTLADSLDREVLVSRLETRLLPYRHFRQKIIEHRFGLGMPRWEDDPSFEVRRHVHSIDLSQRADSIIGVIADIVNRPFTGDRPLWDVYLVRGGESWTALIVKVHHVLADGSRLLALLEDLSDEQGNERLPDEHRDEGLPAAAESSQNSWFVSDARVERTVARCARLVSGVLATARLALKPTDPPTRLRGNLGHRKHAVCSATWALEPLLTSAHTQETTLTCLLLAAVAGALRTFLGGRGRHSGRTLHALLPVHVPIHDNRDVGNHYGSIIVSLPVDIADPRRRLRRIHDELQTLRSRRAVAGGVNLAFAAGLVPAAVERLGVSFFSRKASAMVSNVRGPAHVLHIAGAAVRDVVVWAPSPGSIALGITFMSYAGRARIAVSADAGVIGNPGGILRALEDELMILAPSVSTSSAPGRAEPPKMPARAPGA